MSGSHWTLHSRSLRLCEGCGRPLRWQSPRCWDCREQFFVVLRAAAVVAPRDAITLVTTASLLAVTDDPAQADQLLEGIGR